MKHILIITCLLWGIISCTKTEDIHSIQKEESDKIIRLYTIKTIDNLQTRAVAPIDKIWEAGSTIKIKFLNGTSDIQNKVKLYAEEWLEYACLKFEYVAATENADVKIGFNMDTRGMAWSTIGTDCQLVPQNEPSLNFYKLELSTDEEDIKAEVLRSFGHVLGLGFEHQSPTSPIEFSPMAPMFYTWFKNLSTTDVDELLSKYNTAQTNYTDYDKYSIMVLPIDGSLLTQPPLGTTGNKILSDTDKEFIAELYPKYAFKYINRLPYGGERQIYEAPNGKVYVLSYCGSNIVDISNSQVQNSTIASIYSFQVGNSVYMQPPILNSAIKHLDLVTGNITSTNLTTSRLHNIVKHINGTTYFATDDGLYYLDTDNIIKPKTIDANTYVISSMLNKEDGTIYFTAHKGWFNTYNSTYIYHIDASNNINLIGTLQYNFHKLQSYPGQSKIYVTTNGTGGTVGRISYIDASNNIIQIKQGTESPAIRIGANDNIYSFANYEKNVTILKNGTFENISYDPFSKSQMQFIDINPLSRGLFILAQWVEDNANPNLATWWTDLYYLNNNEEHITRIPTGDIRTMEVFQLSNNKVYCIGYTYTERQMSLWEIIMPN